MSDQDERELRAARNQAMFRAINEKLREVNAALGSVSESYVIACECADLACIETLSISPAAYETIRSHPNRFAVREGHVYEDVEDVISVDGGYAVVEKRALAAELAEATDPRTHGA
jgi:5-bromo-4-chloroindolyl phosphate hydrolysis protein